MCVGGQCRECANDSNCKANFECRGNKCLPKLECSSTKPCPSGSRCVSGQCLSGIAKCKSVTDCVAGEFCVNGLCSASATGAGQEPGAASDKGCNFLPVYFAFNESLLSAETEASLSRYAGCAKTDNLRFTLEGYSDDRGTEEYNIALSQRRADSVKRYLVTLGVSEGSLNTVGYGEQNPVDPSNTETGWAKNRRVEFKARQ